jgi:hypothetical protein
VKELSVPKWRIYFRNEHYWTTLVEADPAATMSDLNNGQREADD